MGLLVVLCGLTLAVAFHELGHYLAALWYRVVPSVFSIGFGPRLLWFKKRIFGKRETEFRVCLLLAGGFVRMPPEKPKVPIEPQPASTPSWIEKYWWLTIPFMVPLIVFGFLMLLLTSPERLRRAARWAIRGQWKRASIALSNKERYDESNSLSTHGPWAEFVVSAAGPIASLLSALGAFVLLEVCYGTGNFATNLAAGFDRFGATAVTIGGNLLQLPAKLATLPITGNFESIALLSQRINESAGTHGWSIQSGLWGFAVLNVLLALFNLLPLPGLDGGNMLISSARGVLPERAGKAVETGYIVVASCFIAFLLGLTIWKDLLFALRGFTVA